MGHERLATTVLVVFLTLALLVCGGLHVVTKHGWLSFGPDRAGERVDRDLRAVEDGFEGSRDSLERLDRGLGAIRDSSKELEGGVERAESRAAELEARSREIEEGFRRIRDAESRGRQAVQLGREANRRLEEVIRRLSEEGGETGETEEGLESLSVD